MTYPNGPQQPGQPYGGQPPYDPNQPYGQPQHDATQQYGQPAYDGTQQYGQPTYDQGQGYDPNQQYGQPAYDPNQQYGQPQYDAQQGYDTGPQYPPQTQYTEPAYETTQYTQPAYGEPQQYGQPQYGAAPAQPYGAAGFAPAPPPNSKKGWIIGGAIAGVLAIGAAVLIVVLNNGDDSTTADGGGGGTAPASAGTGGGATSESQSEQDELDAATQNFEGGWAVIGTVTDTSGGIHNSDDIPYKEGDTDFDQDWGVQLGPCTPDSCTATASTPMSFAPTIDFEWDGTSWQASYTEVWDCTSDTTTVDVTMTLTEVDEDTFEGVASFLTDDACGPVEFLDEDLTLTRN